MIEKETKDRSPFAQYLPENAQGPHMMAADDGSGKSNTVMDAYNAYMEREREAMKRWLRGNL